MGLFGKTPTAQEMVREWRLRLKHEDRTLERQIRSIQGEEAKVKKSLKDAAKKGDVDVCKILAKELYQSKKAVNKLYASKAHINSIVMSMQQQLAMTKLAGALGRSAQVMKSMNALVRVPEIAASMQELSREMMKAGLIEEMVNDAIDIDDSEELEDQASSEVNKILFELTDGLLGQAGHAKDDLPSSSRAAAAEAEDEDEEDVDAMRARLEALRSWQWRRGGVVVPGSPTATATTATTLTSSTSTSTTTTANVAAYVEQLENDLRLAAELGNLLLERNTTLEREAEQVRGGNDSRVRELALEAYDLRNQLELLKAKQTVEGQQAADRLWESEARRRDAEQAQTDLQQRVVQLRDELAKLNEQNRKLQVNADAAGQRASAAERKAQDTETQRVALAAQLDTVRKELFDEGFGEGSDSAAAAANADAAANDDANAAANAAAHGGAHNDGLDASGSQRDDGDNGRAGDASAELLRAELEQLRTALLEQISVARSLESQRDEYKSLLADRSEALERLREQLNEHLLASGSLNGSQTLSDQVMPFLAAEHQAVQERLRQQQELIEQQRNALNNAAQHNSPAPFARESSINPATSKMGSQSDTPADAAASVDPVTPGPSQPVARELFAEPAATSTITAASASASASAADSSAAGSSEEFTLGRQGRQSWERQSQQWAYKSARTKARTKARDVTKWRNQLKLIRRQVSMGPADGRARAQNAGNTSSPAKDLAASATPTTDTTATTASSTSPSASTTTSTTATFDSVAASPASSMGMSASAPNSVSKRSSVWFADLDALDQFDEETVASMRELLFANKDGAPRQPPHATLTASTQTDDELLPVAAAVSSVAVATTTTTSKTNEPSPPTARRASMMRTTPVGIDQDLRSPTASAAPAPVADDDDSLLSAVMSAIGSQKLASSAPASAPAPAVAAVAAVAASSETSTAQVLDETLLRESPQFAEAVRSESARLEAEIQARLNAEHTAAQAAAVSAAIAEVTARLEAQAVADSKAAAHAATAAAEAKAAEVRAADLKAAAETRAAELKAAEARGAEAKAAELKAAEAKAKSASSSTATTPSGSPHTQRAAAAAAAAALAAASAADALAKSLSAHQRRASTVSVNSKQVQSVGVETEPASVAAGATQTSPVMTRKPATTASADTQTTALDSAVTAAAAADFATAASDASMAISINQAPALVSDKYDRLAILGQGAWFSKATKSGTTHRRYVTFNPWKRTVTWAVDEPQSQKTRVYRIQNFVPSITGTRFPQLNMTQLGFTLFAANREILLLALSNSQKNAWLEALNIVFQRTAPSVALEVSLPPMLTIIAPVKPTALSSSTSVLMPVKAVIAKPATDIMPLAGTNARGIETETSVHGREPEAAIDSDSYNTLPKLALVGGDKKLVAAVSDDEFDDDSFV
ncbi:hypothetical protein CAOG_08492 [Capsaspora owczarzaki ATCC 30864]|uniref:Pleckstrin homology domain-containing protein n=1 Tax=Capsaspora owczarzaki (strain ATCC 30864) TaxID=595528 RepID=A0A0D2U3P4_CAPO3|nr:hypothetical protein CAOG_08492 [Capsaspora owczarzaki ATCC 30864]KJE89836.1 hypothetical protein CAOG_008492 [Capsaspora owczarzaki ATCC 30864]|eukprot:XP_011270074.1 hypothetical protein CAOG_08492 [Capsaspora owczarzaki ATCC 30864]